jgi:acetyl-CoA/propionyl-CoA carboxylase biotin carboxyl carrier protein
MASPPLHYVVEFDDGLHFDVHIDPDDPTNFTVDGVDTDVEVTTGPQGLVVTAGDGQRVPLHLRYEDSVLVAETPDGRLHRVRVELAESREWRAVIKSQPPPPAPPHSGRIDAPIAGNVLALCVGEGAVVTAGTPIILLEAMKMQNTIVAPVSGPVHYLVAAGQAVRSGDPLATISVGTMVP